jgi:hypothetical protein
MLAFPAGTVPVTTVRASECKYECPREQDDAFAAVARNAMEGATGLPVGVQVISYPMADETCLRGMKELQKALGEKAVLVPPMAR